MKKPPDRKLVLAVAVLIVAASTMLARSAAGPLEPIHALNHHLLLGVR